MVQPKSEAFRIIDQSRPNHTYRGAVVGCGRMSSTIDDEVIDMPHYPWPWAHATAMIEARGIELVAAADVDQSQLNDFKYRWGWRHSTLTTERWLKKSILTSFD